MIWRGAPRKPGLEGLDRITETEVSRTAHRGRPGRNAGRKAGITVRPVSVHANHTRLREGVALRSLRPQGVARRKGQGGGRLGQEGEDGSGPAATGLQAPRAAVGRAGGLDMCQLLMGDPRAEEHESGVPPSELPAQGTGGAGSHTIGTGCKGKVGRLVCEP